MGRIIYVSEAEAAERKRCYEGRPAPRVERVILLGATPEEIAIRKAERKKSNAPKMRENARCRTYGISKESLRQLIADSDNRCAICGSDGDGNALHLDHDHESGAVRELLCRSCNFSIGFMRDNPDRLRAAANYLLKHRKEKHVA